MIHRVIIADDHFVFRAGVARILSAESDIRVVGQCDDDVRLLKAVSSSPGAIIMFSTTLHPLAASLLRGTGEPARTQLIAVIENDDQPMQYIRDGILGVVHRNVSNTELLQCVRSVGKRVVYMQDRGKDGSESVSSDLVSSKVQERLSPKELQILALIIKGYKNKDIAEELDNSEQVIRNYMRSIFDKTGVSDRLELALFTVHHKLLANAAIKAHADRVPGPAHISKQRNAIAS
jgi:DNA-binding NarL/FixJ family response regulator